MMKLSILIVLILTITTKVNAAAIYRVQSDAMMSLRNDYQQKLEMPIYEYVGANYETLNHSFIFDSNFSFYANPNKSGQSSFELYLLNASYEIIPGKFLIQAGRTADFTKSSSSLLSDQISFRYYLFDKQGSVSAYYGILRDLNADKDIYNKAHEDIKQVGAKLDYHTDGRFPYSLETNLQKEIAKFYSEDYASVGVHGPLITNLWGSEFLFSGEHNITQAQTRRLETGIDFYPSMKLANRWRFLSYKSRPHPNEEHDPIFAVISRGRLYEATTLIDYLLLSNLTLSGSFSIDDYQLQETKRTQGYRTEFTVNFLNDSFNLSNKVYYFKSYGGKILGSRMSLALIMSSPYELSGSTDVTYYEKITSAKATAISSDLLFGKIFKDLKWQIGCEFNTNNILTYDLRFLTKLTYNGWGLIND